MPKIITKPDGTVTLRLDGAYVTNGRHLVEPYYNDDNEKRFFGNFKFIDPDQTAVLLAQAVEQSGLQDTVFEGEYPRWVEDEYGVSLKAQNRVKFYRHIKSKDQIDVDDLTDYIYAIEVHLKKRSKDSDEIWLNVARAIVTSQRSDAYEDDLFEEFVNSDDAYDDDTPNIDISEDDLPF
jgi:hypothetical protein